MPELLTAAQMRAVEMAAIGSGEVTGLELMERAGRGVVEAILEWRPEWAAAPHRAVVLCGPGNNGGDGFVVARLLRQRGWEVAAWLFGDEAKLPPDAAENARRWREAGGAVEAAHVPAHAEADVDLIVDAVFGAGLTRPLGGELLKILEGLTDASSRDARAPVVAVDAPSGLCMDSGRPLGAAVFAELTVTFHAPRPGHFLAEGPAHCGAVVTRSIGIEDFAARLYFREVEPYGEGRIVHTVAPALRGKAAEGHKYGYGHALVLAGGVGKGGAARLAARGALRVGAGLVTLGPPPAAVIENAAQLNAIMLRPVADADALAGILEDPRFNALCLGPGLGVGAHTLGLAAAALAARRGTVLDADALTSFEDDPAALFALLHEACVLTPHMGEFARLFPEIAEKLRGAPDRGPAFSKVDAAREAAARAGCVVLLKGPDTVIARPDGHAEVSAARYGRGAPWLATAGSGDVLSGMIAGLLAQGYPPGTAAGTAAWLHVEAARAFGPGLIAEDLPEMLPGVFRDLGL